MSPWVAIPFVAVAMGLGSWLSYHPTHKAATWFPWALAGLAVANGLLWSWAARHAGDNRTLFNLSMGWDAVTILSYSVLPLVAFGVRLSPLAWVGLVLVVVGSLLVKMGE